MDASDTSSMIEAITLNCAKCGHEFSICRSCWRGQKFCSKQCSYEMKLQRQRNYQKSYSATEAGLEFGRQRQRRRYEKIKLLKSSH